MEPINPWLEAFKRQNPPTPLEMQQVLEASRMPAGEEMDRDPAGVKTADVRSMMSGLPTPTDKLSPYASEKSSETTQSQRRILPDEDELKKILKLKRDIEQSPENRAIKQSLDSQEEFFNKYLNLPRGFDFQTILGTLAHQNPDSFAASAYKALPPRKTLDDHYKDIASMKRVLNADKLALSKSITDQLKVAMGNSYDRYLANALAEGGVKQAVPKQDDTYKSGRAKELNLIKFQEALDKQNKGWDENYNMLQEIVAVDEKSPVSVGLLETFVSKGLQLEVGARTDNDIARASISRAIQDKLKSLISVAKGGVLPPEQVAELKRYAVEKSKELASKIAEKNNNLARRWKNLGDFSYEANEKSAYYKPIQIPKTSRPITFKDIMESK